MASKEKSANPGMTTKPDNTTLILSVANTQKTASDLKAKPAPIH